MVEYRPVVTTMKTTHVGLPLTSFPFTTTWKTLPASSYLTSALPCIFESIPRSILILTTSKAHPTPNTPRTALDDAKAFVKS